MANKATSDKSFQGTLQRGKACLRCRFVYFYHVLFATRLILILRKRKMASLLPPRAIPFPMFALDSDVMALSQRASNA